MISAFFIDVPNLTYAPNENFYGIDSFSFTVSDGDWTSIPGSVTITVNPINDAPIISPIDDTAIDEDGSMTFILSADDVDSFDLIIFVYIVWLGLIIKLPSILTLFELLLKDSF